MMGNSQYTTQLQAGLGLVSETKSLLDLWGLGMSPRQLYDAALNSGQFPEITARRLRNIVSECFAPRYLTNGGQPATHLKQLQSNLSNQDLSQFFLLFTCRANSILCDFVRDVYWMKYADGHQEISTDDARTFLERGIDDGKTSKRWSDATVRRVSAYLTGCCADYGMLERGTKSKRRIIPYRILSFTLAYIAYDLHMQGLGDNSILSHEEWGLFGMNREDVIVEFKKLSLTGAIVFQASGDIIRISWKYRDLEELCDVLAAR